MMHATVSTSTTAPTSMISIRSHGPDDLVGQRHQVQAPAPVRVGMGPLQIDGYDIEAGGGLVNRRALGQPADDVEIVLAARHLAWPKRQRPPDVHRLIV